MKPEEREAFIKLQTQVEGWMATTTEYRVNLCNKIDKIMGRLESLPCRERAEIYKNIGITMKLLWAGLGITFGLIVAHLGWR